MKTKFDLYGFDNGSQVKAGDLKIIGTGEMTTLAVRRGFDVSFINHDEVEEFAINILKAMNSKKLAA